LQSANIIAQAGCLFKLQLSRRFPHLRFHFLDQLVLLAFQNHAELANLLTIILRG
jgi:hypothetical protein